VSQGLSQATLDNLYELGYHSLNDYLEALSEEYGVELYAVKALYNILGENGLFDSIITSLEDY
jgi:hypothetical protein